RGAGRRRGRTGHRRSRDETAGEAAARASRRLRRNRPAAPAAKNEMVRVSSIAETAATVGSIRTRTPDHMRTGRVVMSGPERKMLTTTSSQLVMKENSAPAATLGAMIGSVTRRKATTGLAPRLI